MFNLSGIFRDVVIYSVPAPVSTPRPPCYASPSMTRQR